MTIWNDIYKKYQATGEEYATLRKGLIPEFLDFIESHDFKEKNVFDIACGNGKYLIFLKDLGFKTSGLDSSPVAVEMTKELLGIDSNIVCASMYDYKLPAASYDLIISIAAIHHGLKRQVAEAILNIYQALIPGAYCFITLPDNEGSAHWTMMASHKEIEPGTRVPLSGPEKDLPHSSFTEAEIKSMFSNFSELKLQLLTDRGRYIVIARK